MKDEPEWRLIQRIKNGEQSALRHVLNDHLGAVTHYVARMLHNAPDTEDIVQETFVRFWARLDQYDPEKASLSTWLHRIAHNLCIDHFRKTADKADVHNIDEPADSPANDPETDYQTEMDEKHLQQALMQLNEHQRSAIVMSHYQGLRNKDVALILGVSVEALESTLRRARTKLRDILTAEPATRIGETSQKVIK